MLKRSTVALLAAASLVASAVPALAAAPRPVAHVWPATSYPGNVLLTEDLGVSAPEPDTGAWRGPRFRILGRLPKAELRGCSDTHAANVDSAPPRVEVWSRG